MRYKHVNGLEVSQFALGTWHLPPLKKPSANGIYEVDEIKAEKIFKKAFDEGINFFDTANTYHGTISDGDKYPEKSGNAERILGNFISKSDRESLVIATKVRAKMASFPNGSGLSRKHISWQIKESLKRLKTDYVDLYQLHWEDEFAPHEETMGVLNDLVHRGLAHYIGVSNHSSSATLDMLRISEENHFEKFVTMQEYYNLVDRTFELESVKVARDYSLTLMAYAPLAQGILTGKYTTFIPPMTRASYINELKQEITKTHVIVDKFLEITKEVDATPSQLALAWILKMEERLKINIIPILGVTDISQLDSDLLSLNIKISDDVFERLTEISNPF